jgi:amphi-Trp domain-containing protein
MSDQTEDDNSDDEEYEVDHVVTRAEGASTLRRLADGVAAGSVTLSGDKTVTAAVPEQFELEIEYETEDDEAELEVELEWPLVDKEAVPAESDGKIVDSAGSVDEGNNEATETVDDSVDIEMTDKASKAEFELYQDRANEWRWRLVHDNGNIIADSGEGYSRKSTARKGLESVMRNAPGAAIVDQSD